jgi:NAD(P)-dependent dehydrogenase (short-subunit alcohol dehydrogenase family)
VPLAGRRLLVVGASSGIGRATAQAAVLAGASVAFAARRRDRLDEAVAQPGAVAESARAFPVAADVTDPGQVTAMVATSVEHLGGLDAVVYAAASTHLADIESVDAATWRHLLDTNTVGLSLVLASALGHLRRGWGRVLVLTSDSVGHPFPGLGAYVATKAALESLTRSWQIEHPELDVALVTVGPTATDAAAAWDPGATDRFFTRWSAEGYVAHDIVPATPESVGLALVEVLSAPDLPEELDLAPPRPWERQT